MATARRNTMDGLTEIQKQLVKEIQNADRTGKSLMEQGYARSDIQYTMPILIKLGLVYKCGTGKNTYYSLDMHDDTKQYSATRNLNPIVLPKGMQDNRALAFRMGYTDIMPTVGRVFKGIQSHAH